MMDQDHNKHWQEELRQLPQRFCCHQNQEKNRVSALLGAQIREVNQENTLGCREKTIYGLKRLNEEV